MNEFEEIIQKMMAAAKMAATSTTAQTHEVTTPGSPLTIAAVMAQVVTPIVAQTLEVTTPGFPSASPTADYKDDELKPMHPKDTKPPPEFGGARKDFMAWHDSFSSMLRFRSSKWAKIIDCLKAKRERRLIDRRAKEDYLAYAQVHG